METNQFLLEIFTFVRSIFSVILGAIAIQLLVFLFLAPSLERSSNAKTMAQAIFSFFMLAIGITMMSLSAIPTLIATLGQGGFPMEIYLGLVLIFSAGGLICLWHEYRLRNMDASIKRIPQLIFQYTIATVGQLSLVLAVLYLALALTLQNTTTEGWWSMPLSLFIYGLFLCGITQRTCKTAPVSVRAKAGTKIAAPKRRRATARKKK